MRSKCLHYFGRCFRCCSFALKQRRSFCTPFWGNDSVLYQHAREIISARKTSRKHNNKDPSRLRELSPRWRVKTRHINSTKRTSLSLFSSVVLFFQILSDFPCEFREYNVGEKLLQRDTYVRGLQTPPCLQVHAEMKCQPKRKRTSGKYINLLPGGSASAWAVSSPGGIQKKSSDLLCGTRLFKETTRRDGRAAGRMGEKKCYFFSFCHGA